MTRQRLKQVDTVIIGSGPSALILSYILHGNIPIYDVDSPHPDPILHAKLKDNIDLLSADVDHMTEHFYGSRFPYSTQALPVNVLLDTLVRPHGETDESERKTCIKWTHDSKRVVRHVVLGEAQCTGGQWADNPVKASWDIGALSYAGMLSLPGYSFEQYYQHVHCQSPPFFLRPTRRDVAGYLAAYPTEVGISDSIFSNEEVQGVVQTDTGFHIASHALHCTNLVLASGTFTSLVPARPLLQPLFELNDGERVDEPVLIVGSGFSAADVIISTPKNQKIIHIFKWAPNTNPSPLRACHSQAYPEYAGVYRKMKSAAVTARKPPIVRRGSSYRRTSELDLSRDWDSSYEGLPNTAIVGIEMAPNHAIVTLQAENGTLFQRRIGNFTYVVGRRGSLEYLGEDLRTAICPHDTSVNNITGQTLRERVSENLEIIPKVFITGSLTGDSLIRFSYGACAYAAGKIMSSQNPESHNDSNEFTWKAPLTSRKDHAQAPSIMKGLQGHDVRYFPPHQLQLDRRKSEICCAE